MMRTTFRLFAAACLFTATLGCQPEQQDPNVSTDLDVELGQPDAVVPVVTVPDSNVTAIGELPDSNVTATGELPEVAEMPDASEQSDAPAVTQTPAVTEVPAVEPVPAADPAPAGEEGAEEGAEVSETEPVPPIVD